MTLRRARPLTWAIAAQLGWRAVACLALGLLGCLVLGLTQTAQADEPLEPAGGALPAAGQAVSGAVGQGVDAASTTVSSAAPTSPTDAGPQAADRAPAPEVPEPADDPAESSDPEPVADRPQEHSSPVEEPSGALDRVQQAAEETVSGARSRVEHPVQPERDAGVQVPDLGPVVDPEPVDEPSGALRRVQQVADETLSDAVSPVADLVGPAIDADSAASTENVTAVLDRVTGTVDGVVSGAGSQVNGVVAGGTGRVAGPGLVSGVLGGGSGSRNVLGVVDGVVGTAGAVVVRTSLPLTDVVQGVGDLSPVRTITRNVTGGLLPQPPADTDVPGPFPTAALPADDGARSWASQPTAPRASKRDGASTGGSQLPAERQRAPAPSSGTGGSGSTQLRTGGGADSGPVDRLHAAALASTLVQPVTNTDVLLPDWVKRPPHLPG